MTGVSCPSMGDSVPRRYARPGEFEIPNSVLESSSFKQRLGGQLNSERKSPAPVSGESDIPGESSPLRPNPTPPAGEARLSEGVNQQHSSSGLARSREVRLPRELPLRRNPAPVGSEARLSVNLNQHSRTAVPVSRQLYFPRELPVRRSPAPKGSEGRPSMDLNQYRRRPAPPASRDGIPRRRVSARFELLPEPQSLLDRIGVSAIAQLAFLGLLLLSPMFFPQQMETALKFDVVTLMQPVTHIEIPPTTPPPPPKMKPKVQPKPVVPKPKPVEVQPPQLNPKQPHVFMLLKPQLPKLHNVDAKPVELKPVFAQAEIVLSSNQPKRPKEELKAPNLLPMRTKEEINAPSIGLGTLPATVVASASKVQTGGFGDPHGIRGPANPSKAANINQAGSPNLPGGPGYGNGTGGAQGARGTLASTEGPKGSGGSGGAGTGGANTGVAILSKPNPAYSTEARTIKLEGDIVLEVVFLASGQVQVIGVVSGLGHGLDEAAIQAARLIRFRPAQRNGQPVDFHARVRIEFRLAE